MNGGTDTQEKSRGFFSLKVLIKMETMSTLNEKEKKTTYKCMGINSALLFCRKHTITTFSNNQFSLKIYVQKLNQKIL